MADGPPARDDRGACSPTYRFALSASRADLRGTGGVYPERRRGKFDSETGNYYAYAREYDPRIARFLSADPLGGALGNPQSLNRYSYVMNNPASLVDPLGLFMSGPGCGYTNGDPNPCPPPPPPAEDTWDLIASDPCGWFGPFFPGCGGGFGGGFGGDGPPPPKGYKDCVTAALEYVVAAAEGTLNAPGGGYGLLAYGTVVSAPAGWSDLIGTTGTPSNPITIDPETILGNPQIRVRVGGTLYSTAYGRYQITAATAAGLYMTDFEPATQDAAAATLLNQRGAVAAAMGGDFALAMREANRTWASLPGAPYHQPTISMARAEAAFQKALNGGVSPCVQ